MELSPTAYVILGMLAWRRMSGYEIKALVDKSTRFFWAASYGQIYPELRRLAAAGLIEGKASPQGGRRRNVYRLTQAGQRELEAWLGVDAGVFELRDEGLLKLFFADAAGTDAAIRALDAKRREHERVLARLEEIEATGKPEGFALHVLRYGIECNRWQAQWCERTMRELEAEVSSETGRRTGDETSPDARPERARLVSEQRRTA
jgi:DNA-binding PadR family transcriptional regulator